MIRYALITAAKNEREFIGPTIESVAAQTVHPVVWVIVSDGSDDGTDELVQTYQARYPFIRLIHLDGAGKRQFASQARAINIGYEAIRDQGFDYVGVLDADITLPPDYYARILGLLERQPGLGIAGGLYVEKRREKVRKVPYNPDHVPGAIQVFRRQCLDDINGFMSLRTGGLDTVAETMARMKGWQVRPVREILVLHHRPTGTGEVRSLIRVRYRKGLMDHNLGYHPLYVCFKALRRLGEIPYGLGSLAYLTGFWRALLGGMVRDVPAEFIHYLRQEQLRRVRAFCSVRKRFEST